MIVFKSKGDFKNTERFLNGAARLKIVSLLESYAREGVQALSANTPTDSGETASSWNYVLRVSGSSFSITWTNSNVEGGVPVAILLQYGHGTGTGGYVEGRDYINPAIRPIFDRFRKDLDREVSQL